MNLQRLFTKERFDHISNASHQKNAEGKLCLPGGRLLGEKRVRGRETVGFSSMHQKTAATLAGAAIEERKEQETSFEAATFYRTMVKGRKKKEENLLNRSAEEL